MKQALLFALLAAFTVPVFAEPMGNDPPPGFIGWHAPIGGAPRPKER